MRKATNALSFLILPEQAAARLTSEYSGTPKLRLAEICGSLGLLMLLNGAWHEMLHKAHLRRTILFPPCTWLVGRLPFSTIAQRAFLGCAHLSCSSWFTRYALSPHLLA